VGNYFTAVRMVVVLKVYSQAVYLSDCMGECVNCLEYSAEGFKNEDGHYEMRCNNCGHEWGPFISTTTTVEAQEKKVSTITDWLGGN